MTDFVGYKKRGKRGTVCPSWNIIFSLPSVEALLCRGAVGTDFSICWIKPDMNQGVIIR